MSQLKNQIPLFLFTYNCNKKKLIPELFQSKIQEVLPDELLSLFVFGFQEFCSVLDGSFVEDANRHLIEMNQLLQLTLQEKYNLTSSLQTVSMHIMGSIAMIILSPFASKFAQVRTATGSCGYYYLSLKGGVGTRLTYYPNGRLDSSKSVELSFAVLHLNAFEGEYYYLQRNQSLRDIIRALDFGDGYGLIKPDNHIFIMGDLNYRTSKDYHSSSTESQELLSLQDTSVRVDEATYYKKIESLVLKYDEFAQTMRSGEVLQNFAEPKVRFPPTYKFHVNTAILNSKRSPSWCDRIVYLSTYEEIGDDNLGVNLLRMPGSKQLEQLTLSTTKSKTKTNTNTNTNKNKNQNTNKNTKAETTTADSPLELPHVIQYTSIPSLMLSDHRPVYLNIVVPFNPPQLIISTLSGCLQILPSGLTFDEGFDNFTQLSRLENNARVISGPTTIYLKPTRLDYIKQSLIRPIVDLIIGYGLWTTMTRNGRLCLGLIAIIAWLAYVL